MLRAFARFSLALLVGVQVFGSLAGAAFAQGENPRCPDAPVRFPSGNWIWFAYNPIPPGHEGVDLVDENLATPNPNPPPPFNFPEDYTPVYAPLDGYLNNVGWEYGFYGSVLLTGTLDPIWSGKVPTTNVRLWLTHMASYDGSVSYVVRPSGPIKEGDLIGYQGRANTAPVHLHVGFYDSNVAIDPFNDRQGVLDPRYYFNADVSAPFDRSNYPVLCNESPRGVIERPAYNGIAGSPIAISGYALDLAAGGANTGIDQVLLFLDGYASTPGALPIYPAYGSSRPDVAAGVCGQSPSTDCLARFQNSGFSTVWTPPPNLSAGRHSIALYGRQASTGNLVLLDWRYLYAPFPFVRFLPFFAR